MSYITQADALMVAERTVGQAPSDLRADFGMQQEEIKGNITGSKTELQGELSSFREQVQSALEHNNKMLRGEMIKTEESIVQYSTEQLK